MSKFTRRSVLKGVTAGAITLSFAGIVQAGGQTRYLVGGKGRGLRKRVERAGYTVEHVLADGRVLLVTGPDGAEDDLKDVKGVNHAAQDVLSVPEELGWNADYAYFAGTSMAAPQVTGTAAVLREAAPNATAKQLEKAIEQGAESIEGESKAELGAGRLNVANALDTPVLK